MVDDGRPGGVLDVDQRGQGHAVALGVADLQLADVLDAHAVLRVGLDVDLPVAVLEGEVVDVERAQVGLEGVVDVVERHALGLGLLAVDVDEELGLRDAEAWRRGRRCPAGVALCRPVACTAPCRATQAGVAFVLDLELEAAGRAEAVDGRGAEDADRGFLEGVELLAAARRRSRRPCSSGCFLPLLEGLEDHEHARRCC